MKEEKFSRTAYRVAMRRASHQLLDDPKVFDDPLALRVLGRRQSPNCNRIPARTAIPPGRCAPF